MYRVPTSLARAKVANHEPNVPKCLAGFLWFMTEDKIGKSEYVLPPSIKRQRGHHT